MQDVLPEDIERIEVISGPGATLWGANAVNGVINIITRKSADTQGGVAEIGGGNQQAAAPSCNTAAGSGRDLTYRVYAQDSDQRHPDRPTGATRGDHWSKPQGGFRLDWTPAGDAVNVLFRATTTAATKSSQAGADENIAGGNLTGPLEPRVRGRLERCRCRPTTTRHRAGDGGRRRLPGQHLRPRHPAQLQLGRPERHRLGRRRTQRSAATASVNAGPLCSVGQGYAESTPTCSSRTRYRSPTPSSSLRRSEARGRPVCRIEPLPSLRALVEDDQYEPAVGGGLAGGPRATPFDRDAQRSAAAAAPDRRRRFPGRKAYRLRAWVSHTSQLKTSLFRSRRTITITGRSGASTSLLHFSRSSSQTSPKGTVTVSRCGAITSQHLVATECRVQRSARKSHLQRSPHSRHLGSLRSARRAGAHQSNHRVYRRRSHAPDQAPFIDGFSARRDARSRPAQCRCPANPSSPTIRSSTLVSAGMLRRRCSCRSPAPTSSIIITWSSFPRRRRQSTSGGAFSSTLSTAFEA